MHTAEALLLQPSYFEFEIAIEKSERYKSPGSAQILVELIRAGLILLGIRKNCQGSGRNLLLYLCIRRVIKLTSNY
jgi:hypothetical protein